ncbi:MAG: hypothetical protein J1F16_07800 [Muribaculaceae bacterium]|nr:hypothetical protein [Muribaculaceae bacterium]
MNKNYISLNLFLTASLVLDGCTLSTFKNYAETGEDKKEYSLNKMSRISQNQIEGQIAYSQLTAIQDNLQITTNVPRDSDLEVLRSVIEKIQMSKPLSPEFAEVIEENFWDLLS